jgi:hypothetical protein
MTEVKHRCTLCGKYDVRVTPLVRRVEGRTAARPDRAQVCGECARILKKGAAAYYAEWGKTPPVRVLVLAVRASEQAPRQHEIADATIRRQQSERDPSKRAYEIRSFEAVVLLRAMGYVVEEEVQDGDD